MTSTDGKKPDSRTFSLPAVRETMVIHNHASLIALHHTGMPPQVFLYMPGSILLPAVMT